VFRTFNSCWWSIYHTCRPLWQVSFPSWTPICKIHAQFTPIISSRRWHWKKFINFNGSIYWHWVFHFSILVSVDPQKCLKTWGGTQPYVAFSTLEFRFCVFGRTHSNKCSYISYVSVCCGLCQFFLFGSRMELVVLGLPSEHWSG